MRPGEISDESHVSRTTVFGPGSPHLCECEFCGDHSPLLISTHPVVVGRTGRSESYLVCAQCLPRLVIGTIDEAMMERSVKSGGDAQRALLAPSAVFIL